MGVIFVDEAVELPLGLYLLGVLGVAIAFWFYLNGKWPERWVFPVQGFIGACLQALAWVVALTQNSVWWWNFLTITGVCSVVAAAVGVAFTFRLRRFVSNRIADVLLMFAGACQFVAVCMWLFIHFRV